MLDSHRLFWHLATALGLAFIFSAATSAQEEGIANRTREIARRQFLEADTDSDGKVTPAELENAGRSFFLRSVLRQNDLNNNGVIEKTELESRFARGTQVADADFNPQIQTPAFEEGEGPVVLLDEAHFNFHTAETTYAPFAELLRRDGYVLRSNVEEFSRNALDGVGVLVIATALHEQNQDNWRLPTPSAFTVKEIDDIEAWVADGGSLMLISDHMPYAGAARELGAAFGADFLNGYASESGQRSGAIRFDRETGQLHSHPITRGRNGAERIDWVRTFTGSAFQVEGEFVPLLEFGPGVISAQPEVAGRITSDTPRQDVAGWYQGAVKQHGDGRVAIFGESGMFTAQRQGIRGRPYGMNTPEAAQNAQFLLNTLHWLTGVLDD